MRREDQGELCADMKAVGDGDGRRCSACLSLVLHSCREEGNQRKRGHLATPVPSLSPHTSTRAIMDEGVEQSRCHAVADGCSGRQQPQPLSPCLPASIRTTGTHTHTSAHVH